MPICRAARKMEASSDGGAAISFDLQTEPASGVRPVIVGGRRGNAEGLCRLGDRQASKETKLDDVCAPPVHSLELLERLVEGQEIDTRSGNGRLNVCQILTIIFPAGFQAALVSGAFHE